MSEIHRTSVQTRNSSLLLQSLWFLLLCVCPLYTLEVLNRIWDMSVCMYCFVCFKQWLKSAECSLQVIMLYLHVGWGTAAEILMRGGNVICFLVLHIRSGCTVHCERGFITTYNLGQPASAFHAVTLKIGRVKCIMQVCWDHSSNFCVMTVLTIDNSINFCLFTPTQCVLSFIVSFISRVLKRFADRDLFNCEMNSMDLLSTDFFYEHNPTIRIQDTWFKFVQ